MNSAPGVTEVVGRDKLVRQIRAIGVEEGAVLLVHTSFRAVRPVEGGPVGLIEAVREVIGPRGTLVMPAWSGDDDALFDIHTTPVPQSLGVVPEQFWRMPGVLRSDHCFAFAAAGPMASRIVADPLPVPPHRLESPVGRVWELDGQVLLIGVDHDANTTLHLAETLAAVPYGIRKHCMVLQNGKPERLEYLEHDHCCERFRLAGEWLRERGMERKGQVGHAPSRCFRSRDAVAATMERLAADPLVFLHPAGEGCEECDEARASVRS